MTHSTMPEPSGVTLTGKGEAYAVLHSLRPVGCPHGIDPREWRKAVAARIEAHQDAIMALVEALDGATPDADLEEGGDSEPWLGWPAVGPQQLSPWENHCDDREAVNEDGGDILDVPHDDIYLDLEPEGQYPSGGGSGI